MYDRRRTNAKRPRLLRDLRCVGDRPEWTGNTIWDEVRPTTFQPKPVHQFLDRRIAVPGPRNVMKVRAKQPIEQRISRSLVLGCRRRQATVVDSQMALHTELGCCRSDLALAVGLDDAARHKHVSVGSNGVVKDIVELTQLVAAKANTGCVLAFHP